MLHFEVSLLFTSYVCVCLWCLQGYTACGWHAHPYMGSSFGIFFYCYPPFLVESLGESVACWPFQLDRLANEPRGAPLGLAAAGIVRTVFTPGFTGAGDLNSCPHTGTLHNKHLLFQAPGRYVTLKGIFQVWALHFALPLSGRGLKPH